MSEFLAMGGYAAYVWPSFALTAIVMSANLYFAKRRRNKVIAKLRRVSTYKDAANDTGNDTGNNTSKSSG